MIKPRRLTPLFLALVFAATPLMAQPAPAKETTSAPKPATPAADQSAVKPAPAPREPVPDNAPSTGDKDSPFDYRASEEISEDVPVSFPVDI